MALSRTLTLAIGVTACLGAGTANAQLGVMSREDLCSYLLRQGEGTWRKANELSGSLTSRDLLHYALILCETGAYPERIDRLFQVAVRMQDRDPESRGYGNFRWSWEDGAVLDYNAVEFCMQSGAVIWLRHRDALSDTARAVLREMMRYAIEGCRRHRVPPSYTNIALMNAQCLILLGEALGDDDVADEGYGRLDQFCLYTWENGIHEYDSPTYYGVDLDCLGLIEAFCGRRRGRRQARALLELLWTDIALNWYPAGQRLAGARSRDYNYLHGTGYLDAQLWACGWLEGEPNGGMGLIYPALARWRPDETLRQMSAQRLPRLVRQRWGTGGSRGRTHLLLRDVTLSTSGANYGPMDLPLTVDLPGARNLVRCYFIPDARRDPYGKKKVPAGPHEKTLHLRPFWTATQRRADALGLVMYRPGDYPDNPASLESHFVMPRDLDGLWVGGSRVFLSADEAPIRPVQAGQAVFVRRGRAAIGIRIPWACAMDGKPARVAVVDDGNKYGAIRLSIAHHDFWGVNTAGGAVGAALWVRVADNITDDESFAQFTGRFTDARATADVRPEGLQIDVEGVEGPLALASSAPYMGALKIEPPHTRAILELDGEDIGRSLLSKLEPIRSHQVRVADSPVIHVKSATGTAWEAEEGLMTPPMDIGEDDAAFGSQYVWTPGEKGQRGGGSGKIAWRLSFEQAGTYYLWARVLAPTPEDDSFLVRVASRDADIVDLADWHTGTHEDWQWAAVSLAQSPGATPLVMPAGEVTLELRTREDGTRVDRLLITPDPDEKPN